MTTAGRTDNGRLTAARAVFIGLFGLALGWAGVLVAAVAVAAERAKNGDDTVNGERHKTGSQGWWSQWRERRALSSAQRTENARRWLAEDRKARAQLVEDRKKWLADGGDPTTEPVKPGYARRLGSGARRLACRSRVVVFKARTKAGDFVAGFKEGWQTAAPVAAAGGGFKQAATARPAPEMAVGGEPVDAEILEDQPGNPEQAPQPAASVPAQDAAPDAGYGFECHRCGVTADGFASAEQATTAEANHDCRPQQRADNADVAPARSGTGNINESGDPNMAIPLNVKDVKANTNPGAVDGDDHLDKISAGLGQMGGTLSAGDDHTDALIALARALRAQAAATMERAGDKATTATRQACDEALAQAARYEQAAALVGEASAACAEMIEAADRGLDPGRHARDNLHTAGATGELLATAQDG